MLCNSGIAFTILLYFVLRDTCIAIAAYPDHQKSTHQQVSRKKSDIFYPYTILICFFLLSKYKISLIKTFITSYPFLYSKAFFSRPIILQQDKHIFSFFYNCSNFISSPFLLFVFDSDVMFFRSPPCPLAYGKKRLLQNECFMPDADMYRQTGIHIWQEFFILRQPLSSPILYGFKSCFSQAH